MSDQVYDYWLWKDVFSYNQRVELDKILKTDFEMKEPKEYGASDNSGNFKKSSTVFISKYHQVKHLLSEIVDESIKVNNHKFGYDLFPIDNNHSLNYNIYDSKSSSQYDWHLDTSQTIYYDVKLTLLINNSIEKFEGGNFQLNSGTPYSLSDFSSPGSVVLIKSNILHKVTPVTSGTRNTITMFLCGPRFK